MSEINSYTVSLPVYKQGDDFNSCLTQSKNDSKKAFFLLAQQYEEAARQCRNISELLPEGTDSYGSGHLISVELEDPAAEFLLNNNLLLLQEEDFDDFASEEYDEI